MERSHKTSLILLLLWGSILSLPLGSDPPKTELSQGVRRFIHYLERREVLSAVTNKDSLVE